MEQPDDWMSVNKPYVGAWITSGIEPPKRMALGSSTPSGKSVRFVIDGMATALAQAVDAVDNPAERPPSCTSRSPLLAAHGVCGAGVHSEPGASQQETLSHVLFGLLIVLLAIILDRVSRPAEREKAWCRAPEAGCEGAGDLSAVRSTPSSVSNSAIRFCRLCRKRCRAVRLHPGQRFPEFAQQLLLLRPGPLHRLVVRTLAFKGAHGQSSSKVAMGRAWRDRPRRPWDATGPPSP